MPVDAPTTDLVTPTQRADDAGGPSPRRNTGAMGLPQRGGTRGDKRLNRSKVTNGSVLLQGIPQTSPWVRRCRDLINLHIADLGGEENTSVAERSLVRRASVLSVELEQLEAKFALAGSASADDLDLYSRAASNLRRLLESVGLKRRSRDVTPSLAEYLQQARLDEQQRAAAEAAAAPPINVDDREVAT